VRVLCKTTCFATGIIIVVKGSTGIDGDDHVVEGYEEDVGVQRVNPVESVCVVAKVG